MQKWVFLLAMVSMLSSMSCTVSRLDRCKTTPESCPGLLDEGAKALTIVSVSPASQSTTALPTSIVATFSEGVTALTVDKFVMSGTCAVLPTVSSVTMSADNTVATAALAGGTCANAQSFTTTLTPASITSLGGAAGVGSAVARTYTMIALGPTASLATPSSVLMNSSGTSTIALTYTGATATTLTNAGVTKNETGVSCTMNVSGVSAAGATLTVSNCSGDGTITVAVNAGTASDGDGNLSSASSASASIMVDNTGPTLSSLTPATATVASIPVSVVATFNEAVATLLASDFAVTGDCATLPTVSGVVMSSGAKVATATLTGGTCADTKNVIVTVTPTNITDLAGNHGTGAAVSRTYTYSTAGPSAALGTPSSVLMNSSGTSTIALTYTGATATTLTNAGVTKNETGVSCTVNVSGVSAAGATLTVSNCSGDGTITVAVNAGTATNGLGIPSTASPASSSITIDNSGPTLSSLTPISGNVSNIPANVVATFSEAMAALDSSKFTVGGTCSTLPSVGGVSMSAGDTVATASLSGAVCAVSETVTVTVNPATVTDLAGNVGTGSSTAVTYTKINGTAVLSITGNGNFGDASCGDVSRQFTVTNTGNADAVITNLSTPTSGGSAAFSIDSETCSDNGGVLPPGGTCTVDVTASYNGTGTGLLTIDYDNQTTNTSESRNLQVSSPGC